MWGTKRVYGTLFKSVGYTLCPLYTWGTKSVRVYTLCSHEFYIAVKSTCYILAGVHELLILATVVYIDYC